MRLNVDFVEGKNHAWLNGESDSPELFLRVPAESIDTINGSTIAKISYELAEEAYEGRFSETEPEALFVMTDRGEGTELFIVTDVVVMQGGDAIFFISRMATFH